MSWLRTKPSLSPAPTATQSAATRNTTGVFHGHMEDTGHVPSFYNPRAVPGGDGTHMITMGCQGAWFNHPSPHTQYLMKWFKISLAIQLKVTVLAVIQSFRERCLSLLLLFPLAHHLVFPSSCVFQQWAETSNVFASSIRKHSTTVTSR